MLASVTSDKYKRSASVKPVGEAVLYVRMSEELKQRLHDYAQRHELTDSAAARMLIKQALDREDSRHDQENS